MITVVTGGGGFIGKVLVQQLLEQSRDEDEIYIIDTLHRHGKEELNEILSDTRVKIIEANLAIPDSFDSFPKKVDRVYHLAAIVGVGNVETAPLKVLRVNTISTLNMLDWFIKYKTQNARFLFSSSSEVYSGALMAGFNIPVPTPEKVPVVISDIAHPRFSYALTKMWGEAYINYLALQKYFCLSVRYHNIYGPKMGYEHVIPQIISRIKSKENPFRIIAGDQTRSFCWVEDAAKATRLVMESDKAMPGTIVHIGNENGEISIDKLYKMIFNACNWYPKNVINSPASSGSVARRCPSTQKLKELTGYLPDTHLKEGLDKTINWYMGNL